MRAVEVAAPGRIEVRELAVRELMPGEVRVRLEGSGICASNIPVWEGREWFTYPLEPGAPGHEGWGVVDAVGDAVASVQPGDRVAMLSHHAYAEFDVADERALVPLPPSLAGVPFPGEPLGCAMNIFERADIAPGHTVAIIGIGFLGALLTRLATNVGARVIAISRRPFALDVARQMGAAETIPLEDHRRVVDPVRERTDGLFCDRVIECVGKQSPLDLAGELTRERGRLVIAGFHQDGPRQIDMFLWNWRGIDVVNAHERDSERYVAGMRAALDAVVKGRIDPQPLYTHTYTLDRLDAALNAARERPDQFKKALITL
jgi:threonine dehydrogenase-like Zn-dependent dehydrogenase